MVNQDMFWRSRGFEPWEHDSISGVRRRVTLRKSSLLGEVARYYADDYIVWRHNGDADCDRLFRAWRPERDVMTHRFVFLEGPDFKARPRRVRGFLLGLRGYIEIYRHSAGARPQRGAEDLAALIDRAAEEARIDLGEPAKPAGGA